jgi:hypothetical protein
MYTGSATDHLFFLAAPTLTKITADCKTKKRCDSSQRLLLP